MPLIHPPTWLRRPLGRGLVLLVVLVVAAGVGWLALRPSTHRPTVSPAAPPSASETAAVMQLLQTHAQALTERNQVGWDAGLDDSPAAAGYRDQERAVFTNLADVPLATWRYSLTAPVTDAQVLQTAATRLGGRVVVLHVQLQYAFAVVDPAPTAKSEYLTAVQRPDGWRLGADDDTSSSAVASWHGPWDFGPLIAAAGPHTLVLAHPAHRADIATFQGLVEKSVPVVTSVWGTAWNDQVAVLIPDTDAEFQAVTGDGADSHDIAAVAVADSINPDLSVDPRQAVLGARIVLNPANLTRLDAAGRRLVIQHELTHIAARAQTSDQMPTWVIEGFADYVGNLDSGRTVRAIAPELAAEIDQGTLPTQLPTAADFDGASTRLPQAYEESWLACRLIAATIGQHGLVSFYRAVDTATLTAPATAVSVVLARLLHTTVPGFTARWRTYLQAQFR